MSTENKNKNKKKRKPGNLDLSKLIVRNWTEKDIPELVKLHHSCYKDTPVKMLDDERLYEMQLDAFPDGQFLVEYDGKPIAYATCLIVCLDDVIHPYKFREITGSSTFSTHDYGGDTLYGADIAVDPDYRGFGVASLLYKERKKLLVVHNLHRMLAYGRLTGYKRYAGKMDAKQYVQRVVEGKLKDPSLNAHLKNGYSVKRVLLDFMSDEASMNYATMLEMENPDFDSARRAIAVSPLNRNNRTVRVCAAQYFFRPIQRYEQFAETVSFFVDTADTYHAHFLLLPEYFTAQLFSLMPPDWDEQRTVDELADMSEKIKELLAREAKDHNIYLVGGSTPLRRNGLLYNVSFFCTPSGEVYTQDKLHITPAEREDWNIEPGEKIKIFETPYARVGILICYDIEFPELARLMTLGGVEIIFCPYSTDEQRGYYRIRYTAQARAVENYTYVVTAGNVGNLPGTNYLLNYGRSAIFTPSDFSFPPQAIAAIADPNTETVVVTDLDLNTLMMQREMGNVRPLYDRRPDLYDISSVVPIEIVKTY
jgi:predicted amidohydrolase/GNAT superfamily N-acetyltransferase